MESYKVGDYTEAEKILDNKMLTPDNSSTLDVTKDIIDFVPGDEFYLYNVDAGGFFTGANDWGTHASVLLEGTDLSKTTVKEPLKVRFTPVGNGKYRLEDWGNHKGQKWMNVMCESASSIYVDAASQKGQEDWLFTKNVDGTFTISNATEEGLLSVADDKGNLGMSTAADAKCKWIAVANCNIGATGGSWGEQEEGKLIEAYAGWESLALTEYHLAKEVSLSKGMYKLSIPALYRNGGGYDDAATSYAYIFAGDKKAKIKTAAAGGVTNDGEAKNKLTTDFINTIEFEVSND